MRSVMKIAKLLVLATVCYAQSVQYIVNNTASLSNLASVIAHSSQLSELLSAANNFTFLAPNDDAFSKWLSGNHTQDFVEATLTYHLLSGSYATELFRNGSSFISTALTNQSYANVTEGQRVEVVKNGDIVFQSGFQTTSHLLHGDIIVNGGVVHVIDTVLQIPSDFLQTIMNGNLSYAIAFFSEGRFLGGFNQSLITDFVHDSDLTYFIPNSAQAVAYLQNSSVITEQQFMDLVGYYILVGDVVYSTSFQDGTNLTTQSGLPLVVRILKDGSVYINGAKIIGSDYLISNGVMHILDNLLIPGNTTGPAASISGVHHQVLSTAAKAGIGIGSGVGLILLLILGVYILMKRKHRPVEEGPPHPTGRGGLQHREEVPISELLSPYGSELNSDKRWTAAQLETQERPVELPVSSR